MKKFILVAVMTAVALPVMQHHSIVGNKQPTKKQRGMPRQMPKRKRDYNLIPGGCFLVVT